MKIGVLAIQGSVEEHFQSLLKAGSKPVLVKNTEDLDLVSGLILPGGESTTMGKLLRRFGIREALIEKAGGGMPVWGTCAGAILLAKEVRGKEQADKLDLMNIVVERNAYGRQQESFETEIEFNGKEIPAVFIRAPKIIEVADGVEILASYEENFVAARENNLLVTSFHPELTDDLQVHQYFLEMCR